MKLEKNWLYNFNLSLSIVGFLYIVICGVSSLASGFEFEFYYKSLFILGVFGLWIFMQFVSVIFARFDLSKKFDIEKMWVKWIERVLVIIILGLALVVRVIVVQNIPIQLDAGNKIYYEIAELLNKGVLLEEGKTYCQYISMFPHEMGYCYILKIVFRLFGTSVAVGQYLNIILSVITVFLVYLIAKELGGRIAGLIALVFSAFWPSKILFLTILSPEFVFSFFFYSVVLLFLYSVKKTDANPYKVSRLIIMHIALGIMIALTVAINPIAFILLISIIICIFPQRMILPTIPRSELTLAFRFLEKGWLRCVLLLIPFILVTSFITSNIQVTINKDLPPISTAFGYSLWVGLNTATNGSWNDIDADYFNETFKKTDSATQAHIACRELALVRLTSEPKRILNLISKKFDMMWSNDDFGVDWNYLFLEKQGGLTEIRTNYLEKTKIFNDIIYIISVLFALICLVYLLKRKGSYAYVLVLVFLGTSVCYLFLESQNKYHFHVIEIFIILAGLGIHFMFEDGRKKADEIRNNKVVKRIALKTMNEETQIEKIVDERIKKIRKEEMSNTFNMEDAIKNNHVIMTVSEAYHSVDYQDDKEDEMVDLGIIPKESDKK